MAKLIIGKSKNGPIKTNLPSSEKFNCDAYKDMEKKKKKEYDKLVQEINRQVGD